MKSKTFEGRISNKPTQEIILNIMHLDKGRYILKIVHKDRVLKSTFFIKE